MVEVTFINDYKYSTSSPVYQCDYVRKLIMYGLDTTNDVIQVHFTDNSYERIIVRLASKNSDYYQVFIPVIASKKPEGFTSQNDPIIQTQIELLIIDITESNKELIYVVNTFLTYIVQTIYLSTIHYTKTY